MSSITIPKHYESALNLHDTQIAIKAVKDCFQQLLAERLHLYRVSAPLFVDPASGLNDNLNGVERPVRFGVKEQNEREAAYQRVVDAHPLPSDIRTLIEQYAAENNLQPAFVASIVLNESSYRTDAESGVGARGLMQLMPETAQWIAGKLKLENYSFAMVYDAETNIRFGTWYLNYLAGLFQGCLLYTSDAADEL